MFVVNVYNESGCSTGHFLSFEPLLGTYLEWVGNDLALSALALTTEPNADAMGAMPMV